MVDNEPAAAFVAPCLVDEDPPVAVPDDVLTEFEEYPLVAGPEVVPVLVLALVLLRLPP